MRSACELTRAHAHTRAHRHARKLTHTHTHARTQADTHTHTSTQVCVAAALSPSSGRSRRRSSLYSITHPILKPTRARKQTRAHPRAHTTEPRRRPLSKMDDGGGWLAVWPQGRARQAVGRAGQGMAAARSLIASHRCVLVCPEYMLIACIAIHSRAHTRYATLREALWHVSSTLREASKRRPPATS